MKKVRVEFELEITDELYEENFQEIVESEEGRKAAIADMEADGTTVIKLIVNLF